MHLRLAQRDCATLARGPLGGLGVLVDDGSERVAAEVWGGGRRKHEEWVFVVCRRRGGRFVVLRVCVVDVVVLGLLVLVVGCLRDAMRVEMNLVV